MEKISNELLVEAYYKAKQQRLNLDFIKLIRQELKKRNIMVD
ncbi:sporulation histidine kinase inhibitor Sda [Virgibacillus ndiopensis]|nr:sporulation histidine kinase inhibitor Sda [Virgibacillus ndiopensis]